MLTPKNATAKWLLLSEYIATVDEHKGNSNLCCIILQDKNTDQWDPRAGPTGETWQWWGPPYPRGSRGSHWCHVAGVGPTPVPRVHVGPTVSRWQLWVPLLLPRGSRGSHGCHVAAVAHSQMQR